MRLTLRTLLAYMDNILEPEDSQNIGKKIEESEFATGLLHRTRDAMRRLRLAAPALAERGPGLDPNTVAEYLDNTLPGDRVADFEKVCLDSDVHLAEVASCHQILTMVLGEPAEFEPSSRDRMYHLPHVPAATAPSAVESAEAAADDTRPEGEGRSQRAKPTVPEYLREPPKKRRLLPIAASLALTLSLGALVLVATGQFEPGTFLGNMLGRTQVADATATPDGEPGTGAGDLPPTAPAVPDAPEAAPPTAETPGTEPPVTEPPTTEPPSTELPTTETPVTQTPVTEIPGTLPPAAETPTTEIPAAQTPTTETPGMETPTTETPATETPATEPPGTEVAQPADIATTETTEQPAEATPGTETPQPPVAEPAQPAEPEALGRLMSTKQPLLVYASADGQEEATWWRIPSQGVVNSGQTLLALPTSRPLIALTTGLTIELIDGTIAELLPAGDTGVPGLRVHLGRVIMRTVGTEPVKVRLQVDSRRGVVTLTDIDPVLALAVIPMAVPGEDPETTPRSVLADLYCKSGEILWQEGDVGTQQPAVRIPASSGFALDAQMIPEPVAVDSLPSWIDAHELSLWDRRAAPTVEQSLLVGRSATLGLKELADHRQKEVRWLAERCLQYVDEFGPLVAGLNQIDNKLLWPEYALNLRRSVARSPESAAAVRSALQRQYGDAAPSLYRMLWGYTDPGLAKGDDRALVIQLDSELLAARVLSSWNLKEITTLGLFYKPELTAAKRQTAVRNWHDRLDKGEIRFRRPAAPPASPPAASSPAPLPPG